MSEKTQLGSGQKTTLGNQTGSLHPGEDRAGEDDAVDGTMMCLDEEIQKKIVGWLVLISPEPGESEQFRDFPVFTGKNLIGSHPVCDLNLPYTQYVSPIHSSIRFIDQQFIYTDCDSDQGSFVNYQTVVQAPLKDNDMVGLGKLKFKFKCFVD